MSQIETFRYRGPDQKKLEVHGLAAVGEVFVRRLASGNDHVEGPQSLWRYVVLIDFSVARGSMCRLVMRSTDFAIVTGTTIARRFRSIRILCAWWASESRFSKCDGLIHVAHASQEPSLLLPPASYLANISIYETGGHDSRFRNGFSFFLVDSHL